MPHDINVEMCVNVIVTSKFQRRRHALSTSVVQRADAIAMTMYYMQSYPRPAALERSS